MLKILDLLCDKKHKKPAIENLKMQVFTEAFSEKIKTFHQRKICYRNDYIVYSSTLSLEFNFMVHINLDS